MNPIIEAKKPEIIALCRKHGVVRLDLFGSATGPSWSPETSDFDFVVEFADYGPGIFVRFIDFGDEMERLLGRRVDLISEKRMKPRFRRSVEETRQVVLT
ncbi:MAG TPA: nucleotidyltransferase domain-containing protein [Thermomicrobiales bacterium]|nr:nucleotidyltransferase domain-containing protein [Thermomicrobiales bacterium]